MLLRTLSREWWHDIGLQHSSHQYRDGTLRPCAFQWPVVTTTAAFSDRQQSPETARIARPAGLAQRGHGEACPLSGSAHLNCVRKMRRPAPSSAARSCGQQSGPPVCWLLCASRAPCCHRYDAGSGSRRALPCLLPAGRPLLTAERMPFSARRGCGFPSCSACLATKRLASWCWGWTMPERPPSSVSCWAGEQQQRPLAARVAQQRCLRPMPRPQRRLPFFLQTGCTWERWCRQSPVSPCRCCSCRRGW